MVSFPKLELISYLLSNCITSGYRMHILFTVSYSRHLPSLQWNLSIFQSVKIPKGKVLNEEVQKPIGMKPSTRYTSDQTVILNKLKSCDPFTRLTLSWFLLIIKKYILAKIPKIHWLRRLSIILLLLKWKKWLNRVEWEPMQPDFEQDYFDFWSFTSLAPDLNSNSAVILIEISSKLDS